MYQKEITDENSWMKLADDEAQKVKLPNDDLIVYPWSGDTTLLTGPSVEEPQIHCQNLMNLGCEEGHKCGSVLVPSVHNGADDNNLTIDNTAVTSSDIGSKVLDSDSVNSSGSNGMCQVDSVTDDSDDILVNTSSRNMEHVTTTGVVADMILTNGLSANLEGDSNCWGNCVPEMDDDGEMVDKDCIPLIMENCVNMRKNSLSSASDANSNESRDRNANQRNSRSSAKEKSRRGELLLKEKTVITHSFDFPTELCGRLIGHRGRNIALIKEKSGAEIFIKAKVYDLDWQVVKLEGSRQQVNKALDMIRRKFPSKRFPVIDYDRANPDVPVVPAELMRLILPYGVPVEVVVSHVVSPNHVFVQQPTHPTFPLLERQSYNMRACYSVDNNVPQLPRPIEVGMVCAAPLSGDWFRAQVVQSVPDADEYDLKLVDFGGYVRMPGTCLRQIRSDFMSVPFQAIECYLANVIPPQDDEEFPANAKTEMEELVKGCILQCDVLGMEYDGVQYVMLTKITGTERLVVNRELVNRSVARWLEM
jgi:A-kinase anchor protein 1